MKNTNYTSFCEELINEWSNNKLSVKDNFGFDLNALPEPYLTFGKVNNKVTFLTTNPGGVMNFQRKKSGYLRNGESYNELSKRLSNYYEKNLTNAPKTRINNMYQISSLIQEKTSGFIQYEISPFHSSSFPNKEKFAQFVINNNNNIHHKYISFLKEEIKKSNCISIQAGFPDLNRLNKNWLKLISNILSVNTSDWKSIYFKYKNEKPTTGAFYYKTKNNFKVILFNSAGNSCPKIDTLNELFDILKS